MKIGCYTLLLILPLSLLLLLMLCEKIPSLIEVRIGNLCCLSGFNFCAQQTNSRWSDFSEFSTAVRRRRMTLEVGAATSGLLNSATLSDSFIHSFFAIFLVVDVFLFFSRCTREFCFSLDVLENSNFL